MNKMETNTNKQDTRRPYLAGGGNLSELASPYNIFGVRAGRLNEERISEQTREITSNLPSYDYLPIHPLIFALKKFAVEREELKQILDECDTVDNMLRQRESIKPQVGAWPSD